MRVNGKSISRIERLTGVSRSTLSGWFKGISLTEKQLSLLKESRLLALVKAREKAVLYHRLKKQERVDKAFKAASSVITSIDGRDKNISKLALAMLFAGEGFKSADETSLGNSDPKIVKGFIKLLDIIFGLDKQKLRIYLNLRADQIVDNELKFWSDVLEIETNYFKIAPVDKRTINKPTFANYHGVCTVRYYNVAIKRELLAIAEIFLRRLT